MAISLGWVESALSILSFEDSDTEDLYNPILTIERYQDRIKTERRDTLNRRLGKTREADIKDRSKGDLLSMLIAISQTTWFLLQCIARGQQKLALTELELVTLALASLNAITYAFWWQASGRPGAHQDLLRK